MKRFISVIILTLSVLMIQAQGVDAKAKGILDKVSAKTKTYTSIKAQFSLKITTEDGVEKNQGILLLKGNKYQLILPNMNIYCDGKTIWTFTPEVDEVTITEPDEEDETLLSNPSKIFTMYETGFKYKYINEVFEKGMALQNIDLFPINPEGKEYARIKLQVNKDKMHIYSITTIQKDGSKFAVEILKFTPNVSTSDADFMFDASKHPDVEEVDLRD